MDYVKHIFEYTIAAFGGSTVTFVLIMKFGIKKISDLITSKVELEHSKQIEKYKADINRKTQISKFRFDKEFEILQHLVSAYFEFTYLSGNIILNMFNIKDDTYVTERKLFSDKCNDITKYFYKNCALIDKNVSDCFESGIKTINSFMQLSFSVRKEYEKCEKLNLVDKDYYNTHFITNFDQMTEINKGLNDVELNKEYCYSNLINVVRDYLNSFEII